MDLEEKKPKKKLTPNQATIKALNSQDIRDKMDAQGAEPVGSSPEEFRLFIKNEIDKWEQVIIKSGAKFD